MTFLSGFVSYGTKFIIFGAIAFAGLFFGKTIRQKKDASK